jgi:hypothetical protein
MVVGPGPKLVNPTVAKLKSSDPGAWAKMLGDSNKHKNKL